MRTERFSSIVFTFALLGASLLRAQAMDRPGWRIAWTNQGAPRKLVEETWAVEQRFGDDVKNLERREEFFFPGGKGPVWSRAVDADGSILRSASNEYDDAGFLLRRREWAGVERLAFAAEWRRSNFASNQGLVVEETVWGEDGKVARKVRAERRPDGRETNRLEYRGGGSLERKILTAWDDVGGRTSELVLRGPTGQAEARTVFSNEDGRPSREVRYGLEGRLLRNLRWIRGSGTGSSASISASTNASNVVGTSNAPPVLRTAAAGELSEEIIEDGEGNLISRTVFRYDASGRLAEKRSLGARGVFLAKTTLLYDAQGRKIEECDWQTEDKPLFRIRLSFDEKGNPREGRSENWAFRNDEAVWDLKRLGVFLWTY